ncbi:hypothetical protein [Nitrosospira multiformis]|uniref:Uncharacterized protein n=1 Tax=Nitrosospira multiformis TaxID=1231 RepID=A0A1I7HHU9_9PROT|nr:hypothetical protein [Nitrosospira multiformis]SFU60354.1 hypothetical protein SAMN05216417_10990 [Nitrosospira multiformis]
MPERPVGGVFASTFAILGWRQLRVERVEREYGQGSTPSQGVCLRQRILPAISISVDDTWIEIGSHGTELIDNWKRQ